MNIEIISFGKISDLIPSGILTSDQVEDTDTFRAYLEQTYPALNGMKYKLALNKILVQGNLPITDGATIAIMPPFSGG